EEQDERRKDSMPTKIDNILFPLNGLCYESIIWEIQLSCGVCDHGAGGVS
ncbi:hypothetical protein MKW98_028548, partial [Papaver atlanticum]